jgi:hypothetical protein
VQVVDDPNCKVDISSSSMSIIPLMFNPIHNEQWVLSLPFSVFSLLTFDYVYFKKGLKRSDSDNHLVHKISRKHITVQDHLNEH